MTQTARGFDFSHAMSRLCRDIAGRMMEFSHVRMDEVAVSFAQARSRASHGLQAKLTPMRFDTGSLTTSRRGRAFTVQRLFLDEREMLYILTFYLPRFLNHDLREKLITVFHELYHISPEFDGDIRRFDGHCHVHSRSQKEYDREMEGFVDRYLANDPPPAVYEFLRWRFADLQRRFGRVIGLQVRIPKLIPLEERQTA